MNLFENYVDNGLNFARKKCVQAMQQVRRALENYRPLIQLFISVDTVTFCYFLP